MTNEKQIQELADRGALFVLNHSGGKDSQAMTIRVRSLVPAEQLLVIHAVLPEVTWSGDIQHIRDTIGRLPLVLAHAVKTFFEMVDHQRRWPSPSNRQCTSDLKRGPNEREIRRWIKKHSLSGLVVQCMGLRAEESPGRAKAETFRFSERNSKAGREWYYWLPIHHLLTEEIFATIHGAGEKAHWVYAAGMTRLSCCFCIMASKSDLCTAAKLTPDLYARYVAKEKEIDQTLTMPPKTGRVWLEQLTGVPTQAREGEMYRVGIGGTSKSHWKEYKELVNAKADCLRMAERMAEGEGTDPETIDLYENHISNDSAGEVVERGACPGGRRRGVLAAHREGMTMSDESIRAVRAAIPLLRWIASTKSGRRADEARGALGLCEAALPKPRSVLTRLEATVAFARNARDQHRDATAGQIIGVVTADLVAAGISFDAACRLARQAATHIGLEVDPRTLPHAGAGG